MIKKTYRQLRKELDDVLVKLQDPITDIDDAIVLHEKAKELIVEIEAYLGEAQKKIKEATE